jgi:hypothetical protein
MTLDELERIRAQWQDDAGVAAKVVVRLVDAYRTLLDNLTSTQERCTELLNEVRRLHAGIHLAGWSCPACRAFNGSERGELSRCRACEAPRPT